MRRDERVRGGDKGNNVVLLTVNFVWLSCLIKFLPVEELKISSAEMFKISSFKSNQTLIRGLEEQPSVIPYGR